MAGRIRSTDIEELRRKAGLVEVAAEYMQVRKAGSARFKALCPFHQEKTPSFMIDAAKGLYHCKGCDEGGDVITLVSKLEGLTFVETVERLAAKVGLTLTYEQVSPREREAATRKLRLIAAHREAAAFYHDLLMSSPEGKAAREYLKGRGLTRETVEAFQLGWSPARSDELCRHLLRRRFTEPDLIEGGLALRSQDRGTIFDRFRGRVMFPTFDVSGEPVGFGGRVLDKGEPKYLNSAETPIHRKGSVMYGLNWAKKAVSASGRAIVVEGYMDVIALHQAGVTETVATNGIALSLEHLLLLRRFAPLAILALDSDAAGGKATERAFEAAMERALETSAGSAIDVRVLALPDGLDPADFVTARGPEALTEQLRRSVSIVEYRLLKEVGRFEGDLGNPDTRIRAAQACFQILAHVPNEAARVLYAGRVAEWTKVDVNWMYNELARAKIRLPAAASARREAAPRKSQQVRLEREALKVALQYPAAIGGYQDEVDMDTFTLPAHRAIWRELREGGDAATMADRLLDRDAIKIATTLAVEPIEGELDHDGSPPEHLVSEVVTRLKDLSLSRRIDEKKVELQRINPLEREGEYRERYVELIELEGERKRLAGVQAEAGVE